MSGLYNALYGYNKLAALLSAVLELDTAPKDGKWPTGRFRDIWLNPDKTITLWTRNGGGNREEYQGVFDELSEHPNYIRDYDDDFDCTYAGIVFSIPDEWKEQLEPLIPKDEEPSLLDKTNAAIEMFNKKS